MWYASIWNVRRKSLNLFAIFERFFFFKYIFRSFHHSFFIATFRFCTVLWAMKTQLLTSSDKFPVWSASIKTQSNSDSRLIKRTIEWYCRIYLNTSWSTDKSQEILEFKQWLSYVRKSGLCHWSVSGESKSDTWEARGGKCSCRPSIQFVSSYFKYCEMQNRHQRFSQLQTDAREGENRVHDFTRLRANSNQMLDAVWLSWSPTFFSQKGCSDFLLGLELSEAQRTPGYLRLCCPSFALCLPYKYSPRIKGSPLASWPVAQLSLVPAKSV